MGMVSRCGKRNDKEVEIYEEFDYFILSVI
jgi:hypothetical protein